MYVDVADTGRELIANACFAAFMQGSKVSPRGLNTLELRPGLLRLTNPRDSLATRIGRDKLSGAVAAAEALQLISGDSWPELMFEVAPSFRNYTNDVGTFDGAYGPRITNMLRHSVIPRLKADGATRQAIAIIYDRDDAFREASKDYPCTLSLHFLLREARLCLAVTMRSNDIWLGLPYDLFQFTQLQCSVANALSVNVGDYTHLANSLHLYESNWTAAEAVSTSKTKGQWRTNELWHANSLLGVGKRGMDWQDIRCRATLLLRGRGRELKDLTNTERWYMTRLADAHKALSG